MIVQKNVGGMDRGARLVVGPALLAVGLKKGGGLGYLMAGAGTVLLATGATRYCPANGALGIDTQK